MSGGRALLDFSDAAVGTDLKALNSARAVLAEELGPHAVSGAAAVIAGFTKNDRIANGIGIPVDPMVLKGTEELRSDLGLNDFGSAINTFKHGTS